MTDDLEPIAPAEAVELYLAATNGAAGHRESDLRAFVAWCRNEGGIDDMNDLDGRDLHEFRLWRRDGGYSMGGGVARRTVRSNLATIRSFLRFCGEIEAVPEDLYRKVPLPESTTGPDASEGAVVPVRETPVPVHRKESEPAGTARYRRLTNEPSWRRVLANVAALAAIYLLLVISSRPVTGTVAFAATAASVAVARRALRLRRRLVESGEFSVELAGRVRITVAPAGHGSPN